MKMIISDLDGCLLDHDTYSFKLANEALLRIKELAVPLIICSSKTRGEIELYRNRLGIYDPFIAENGGAIYIPKKDHNLTYRADEEDDIHAVITLGTLHSELKEAFINVKKDLNVKMKCLSDFSISEVMKATLLTRKEAMLAKERSFTEPFILSDDELTREEMIMNEFANRGYQVVRGGRFYHLMGNTDKGAAAKKLIGIYLESSGEKMHTLGVGDSENDLSMFEVVDLPVLIRKPDGLWIDLPGTKNYTRTRRIGPEGWNEAVLDFLAN